MPKMTLFCENLNVLSRPERKVYDLHVYEIPSLLPSCTCAPLGIGQLAVYDAAPRFTSLTSNVTLHQTGDYAITGLSDHTG